MPPIPAANHLPETSGFSRMQSISHRYNPSRSKRFSENSQNGMPHYKKRLVDPAVKSKIRSSGTYFASHHLDLT
jgi:hypothetical protein